MARAGVGADVRAPELPADLTASMQRCLLAADIAQRRDHVVTTTGVAHVLGYSKPSSLEMLGRLERAGLLARDPSGRGHRCLTLAGRREIAALRRRQSLLEQFLRRALDLEVAEAAAEAAVLAPSVSRRLEMRIRESVWPDARPCSQHEPA